MTNTVRPVAQKIPAPKVPSASYRAVRTKFEGRETLEGAGVRLRRMFGNSEVPLLDPFLLLDNFGSTDPRDYLAGFPWHPHRGIETVTYMLNGKTDHEDSLGNRGTIGSGDVQWMSSGSGILHQEMPQRTDGLLAGYQLWVNLPRSLKMEAPAYRGLDAQAIPVVTPGDGTKVKVVAGAFDRTEGPVTGIPVDPTYLDVSLPSGGQFDLPVKRGYTVFAQAIEGSGEFAPDDPAPEEGVAPGGKAGETMVYADGDRIRVRAAEGGLRFLVVSGRPLHEPVAWYGPIVMNTQEEILQAARELREGTFIRSKQVLHPG